ncbi:hypothetical protein [Bacillus sp. CGMCC 1.16541]|uniref:hypothetical protein n=1 Tax=Bacillus sp. CGMCC 1.16541 TaxID=2185143 RepID=UPI000D72E45E|nr:hypothetical protein [Bacillus sp. CGMCC 1.16541]
MITPVFVDLLKQDAVRYFKKAIVTIDGVDYEYPIDTTIVKENEFKHYIYVQDEPVGVINKVVMLDELDRELMIKEPNFNKGDDGWYIAFKVKINIEEVEELGDQGTVGSDIQL